MNSTSFRGRGCIPRGRKPQGLVTGIRGTRIPQPNFIQSNRESHVPPGDFWLEHSSPLPWQQINGPSLPQPPLYSNFEPHRYRGRPQFCTGLNIRGNGKKIRGESRPRPGILPTPGFRGMGVGSRPPQSEPLRFPPPLGSEEERQQKIAETADKIKQKLSLLGIGGNTVNFWEDDVRDVNFSQTEEQSVTNKAIPELKHEPPELDLTVNDFKVIGRVDPDINASLCNPVKVVKKNSKPEVEEMKNKSDSNAWDDTRHKNVKANVNEPSKINEKLSANCRLTQSIECAQGTVARHKSGPKDSCHELTRVESDQMIIKDPNYAHDQKSSTSKLSSELSFSQTEKNKNESKQIAGNSISNLKPEFNKVREKLREVIKVERQNEKEVIAGPPVDNRTTLFQHATGPRLQPPVRLDFHPGIRPRVPRFQGSSHFHPPFRPEHGMEMRPTFRPDFPPRFNHGPNNVNNIPLRLQGSQMIPQEFNGRTLPIVRPRQILDAHNELNMQLNFDPREPPPRFNTPVFNPNGLPPKFCPPSGLNGFQRPSGFYQNAPRPRFVNQDQNPGGLQPSFAPNLSISSPIADFSQLVPPSYNQIPQMHCSSYAPPINGPFNPAMPPPNPASCIIPKFPPPSVPSSASSSSCSSPFATETQSIMQLPPIPINALEIQPPPPPPPHPPPIPPPPPPLSSSGVLDNVSRAVGERNSPRGNDDTTPNMKDELEEMQEALEFAKQFMNMSNDEIEDDANNFNMLMFPDLAPIPPTQPSNVGQEPSNDKLEINDTNKRIEVCKSRDDKQIEELNPRIVSVKMITEEEFLSEKQKDERPSIDVRSKSKVEFIVNPRSKNLTQINEWQNQNNEDYYTRHGKSIEKALELNTQLAKERANKLWEHLSSKEGFDNSSSEKRKNQKDSQQQRDENKEQDTRTSQSSSGHVHLITTIIDSNIACKDIANDSIDQSKKNRGSGLKLCNNKSLLTSTVDANWKDKVINQFLKMSKNDICNMVNSSGLRKFDIAMKHLVKERKYSLSQERRSSADDAIKGYDMSREEFMNQLSAMLDPSATVDIKNLPSKFIQHLSEVLKLDVESHLSDNTESWPAKTSLVTDNMDVNYNNGSYNDRNNFFENNNQQDFDGLLNSDSFSVHIKPELQPTQAIQTLPNSSNLFRDRQINNDQFSTRDNNDTSSNTNAINDIFTGIAEAEFIHELVTPKVAPTSLEDEKKNDQFHPHDIIRVRGLTTMQISGNNFYCNDMLSSRSEDDMAVEKTGVICEEKSQEKYENIEGWNRRKTQDPDMFRNLTKEEWEAKYSNSSRDSLVEKELVLSRKETSSRSTNSPRSTGLKGQQSIRNNSPALASKEINWNTDYVPERNDESHKWPRLKDNNSVTNNDTDRSSNCVSRSIDSDRSAPSDVAKSFKVIKSREKIAKNISIDQRIRDEVSTEIELAKRRDQEFPSECKIREDDGDTKSKKTRDKLNWNNSGFEKNEIGKEISDRKGMEYEKGEVANNVENFSHSDPAGPDERDKMSLQKQQQKEIESPEHPKCFTNDQGIVALQDCITSPPSQELAHEVPSNEALPPNEESSEEFAIEKESEHPKSLTPPHNHSENLELKEINNTSNDRVEIQSNKSGTKKIDIQAYKARKQHRNNEKQDNKTGEIETDSILLDSGSIVEPCFPIRSEGAINQSKNECKQTNVSKNLVSTNLIEEKNSTPKLNSVKNDERKSRNETKSVKHQNSDKSKEELHREEKFTKNRSRNHSRDSHRSRSREDNHRTSKEKSQRSSRETVRYSKSEDKPRSKSPRNKNYNFESKNKTSAKHRSNDTLKEINERIEKRDKHRKTIVDDKSRHKRTPKEHHDVNKKGHCGEPSLVRHTSDKILSDAKTMEDSQQRNDIVNDKTPENHRPVTDSINIKRKNDEMLTDVTEISVNLEISQVTINKSTESSLGNKRTLENDASSPQAAQISDSTKLRKAEDSSNPNEEEAIEMDSESTNPESTFHAANLQEDVRRLSSKNKDHPVQNDMKDCSVTEEMILEFNKAYEVKTTDNSDVADTKSESLSDEITTKTKVPSKFTSDELKFSSQSDESEVKIIIDHLIQRVIFKLDSMDDINEDRDNILKGNDAEITISSPAASASGVNGPSESIILDFNSPETPESPLKGFSEETIKSSILGKRKLVQSVLKITEGYIQDRGSEDPDNTTPKIITESDSSHKNSSELTLYSKSDEIHASSAADERLDNICTEIKTNRRDDEKCCNKSEYNKTIIDQKIESNKKEHKKNPDKTATCEKYKTCVRSITPSGDTLSLGSSIDFDNSEFIVLSEISSDENFSQDEERKREKTLIPENNENANASKLNTKKGNLKKAEESAILNVASQENDNIVALTIAQSTKFEANRSSNAIPLIASETIEANVENLAESSKNFSHSEIFSQSELESSQSQTQNTFSAAETSTANVLKKCKEQLLQVTDSLSETIVNDGRLSSCCESIQSDNPVIVKNNVKKSFSIETKYDYDKTKKIEETVQDVEPERTKNVDVSSKTNSSSSRSNANKNMHRVKQTHRGKRKRKKKQKLDEKKIKESLKNEKMVTVVKKFQTKEAALARIAKIETEIEKLLSEKMKINQMLKSGVLPTEKSRTGEENNPSILESVDPRPLNNENNETAAKLTKVDSKTKSISSHSKSSKNITSNSLEDDVGNRSNGNEKEKKKKSNKRDRSSSQDNSTQETESRSVSLPKASSKKSADIKSSVTKQEKGKEDCSSQSSRQQEGGNSSSTLQHEKYTSRIDKEITLAKNTDQATLNKSVSEFCQKSAKIDNHGRSHKKVNKIADSRDDTIRQSKKEGQHSKMNDKLKSMSRTSCEIFNDTTVKQLPDIYLDESNQESGCVEQKGDKKNSKGLVSLEESYKQDKTGPRKRKRAVFCKRRKGALKCSSESHSRALSPSEEEMPLQLLYIKKFNQKLESPKSAESSSGNNKPQLSNTKLKRTRSTEVLDHVIEVINAVAQNKTGQYRKSNKIRCKSEKMVDAESDKVERKEKILKKLKRDSSHVSNRSAASESKDVWSVADLPNSESRSSYGKSLDGNDYRNNLTDFDDHNDDKNGAGSLRTESVTSVHDSDVKSSTDKIVEIHRERSDRGEIAYSGSRPKSIGIEEDVDQVSPFENFDEEDIDEMFRGESGKYILSEQWNITEDEMFDYTDDIPQLLENDSDLIPQDSISHSNSTSCNLNMDKGLDIVDLMLKTVASDFEKTSKNLSTTRVQKRKRKRVISGDKESENDRTRVNMTRSRIMNCTVRLVDCKYTHLKNYQDSRARQKSDTSITMYISDESTEFTYPQKCDEVRHSQIKNMIESYAHRAKSKGNFSPELTPSKELNVDTECQDWSLEKPELMKDDKVVPPPSTELFVSRSDFELNITEGNSDNDLEMIESQTSSELQSLKNTDCSEKLIKAGNSQHFDEIQIIGSAVTVKPPSNFLSSSQLQEYDEEVAVISDTREKNSPKCEFSTPAAHKQLAECGLRAKPLSKLVDSEVHLSEANAQEVENIKERVEVFAKTATDEAKTEQYTSNEEKPNDVEIINPLENREDNEIQEVELPRIQYSVHKGPILDLKVFGDSILAASEDGVIYRYSQTCNGILNTYEGHKSAVTCIYVLEVDSSGSMKDWLFSGSLDGSLRCYDIKTSMQVRGAVDVGSSIQCMDQSWGVIFLGTKSGHVSRFHIKANAFRGDEIKFSDEAVLGLKATTEGPRRVLIVASRNQPITIRDAQTGLLIRTISGHKSHTVYSLLMDCNLVYCGTSGTAIPVFDFINGLEIKLYNAGPGIVCMRMYKQLLFAGCYDGNIYIFDTKEQKIVCSIPGPGNMLLSMDIVDDKIVAGSKDRRLHMWQMPEQVHRLLAART